MGLAKDIALGLLIVFILLPLAIIILTLVGVGVPHAHPVPNPVEVNYTAAGLLYMGPPTKALAGYYCVYQVQVASDGWLGNCNTTGYVSLPNGVTAPIRECTFNPSQQAYSPPGYSIQLNAQLSNGLWLQNVWGSAWSSNGSILLENAVLKNGELQYWAGPPAEPCGWLVIVISNGIAYFGYSSDGVNVDWYASYPVGNATITNFLMNTGLVIGGPGSGAGVDFNKLYVVFSLWYWNGTAWAPAPVTPTLTTNTAEFVTHAWTYVSGNNGVVSWPEPVNSTISTPRPGFTP